MTSSVCRVCQQVGRAFVVRLAIVGLISWAVAGAVRGSSIGESSADRPAVIASHPSAPLSDYSTRAAELRAHAISTGRLDYAEVVAAAYPPGTITAEVLAAKAAWRASLGTRGAFTILADYRLSHVDAKVETLTATSDTQLKSTLVAQYEANHHWIGLAPAASDFCAFHEAGHSLQRDALRARGSEAGHRAASHATPDRFEAILQAGQADPTSVARLRYLSSQDEFEVRLQDLNRFHATCVADRPIMTPLDSLRALTALGVPVSFSDAKAAFAAGNEPLARSDFEAIVASTPLAPSSAARMFEDARELRLLRRLALRVAPDYWPRLLAKIIFEAPGHV